MIITYHFEGVKPLKVWRGWAARIVRATNMATVWDPVEAPGRMTVVCACGDVNVYDDPHAEAQEARALAGCE